MEFDVDEFKRKIHRNLRTLLRLSQSEKILRGLVILGYTSNMDLIVTNGVLFNLPDARRIQEGIYKSVNPFPDQI